MAQAMNQVGFLKSFTDLRGRDMGGYKAHVKLSNGRWLEVETVQPSEQAAEKAAKQIVDANA